MKRKEKITDSGFHYWMMDDVLKEKRSITVKVFCVGKKIRKKKKNGAVWLR